MYFLLVWKLLNHHIFKKNPKLKKEKAKLFNSFHCIRIKVSLILFTFDFCEAGAEGKCNLQKETQKDDTT